MPTIATTDPVISQGAVAGLDPSAAQMANTAANRLTSGAVYPGVVLAANYTTQTLSVIVNSTQLSDVVYVGGALGAMLGLTTVSMPSPGARVIVFYTPGESYAIGTQASIITSTEDFGGVVAGDVTEDAKSLQNVALQVEAAETQATQAMGFNPPEDMYPGEAEITTGAGPFMRFLFNFAQMSGGGLAAVETHLLNDMVRIIDNCFAHHSVGGDDLIWSNGRCNSESHFTGYPHEAEGKLEEDTPLAKSAGDGVVDPLKSCDNSFSDTGRWRLSTYKGFLADMLHTWVTDPTEVISTYMKDSWRAGKVRTWVGSDGTVMVQSVGGVHIEVAPRIVIPSIQCAWNDPEFNAEEAMNNLDDSFLKIWGKGPDWKDIKTAVWQMRAYAKYISLWHSLARWKQMEKKKYCSIPTEKDSPAPSAACAEKDKTRVNPSSDNTPGGYASITLLPDGSLSVISRGDTSVVMSQGNIQFNAPGNIEINAGGTVAITGKNVTAKALDIMELVSLAGSLYLKARTAFNALCEKGRMWFKSDMEEDPSDPGTWPADGGEPASQPEGAQCGIVMDASKSKVMMCGDKGAVVASTGADAPVCIQTGTGINDINICGGNINMVSEGSYLVCSNTMGFSAYSTKIDSTDIKLGDDVLVNQIGITTTGELKANSLVTKGVQISSFEKNIVPKDPIEIEVESDQADSAGEEALALSADDLKFQVKDIEQRDTWKFNAWTVGNDVLEQGSLKAGSVIDRCIAQPAWQKENMLEVNWRKCRLEPGLRTDRQSMPWPGAAAGQFEFSDTQIPFLGDVWDKHFTEDNIKGYGDMQLKDYRFMVLKSDELT